MGEQGERELRVAAALDRAARALDEAAKRAGGFSQRQVIEGLLYRVSNLRDEFAGLAEDERGGR